jgi:hypothetical protein
MSIAQRLSKFALGLNAQGILNSAKGGTGADNTNAPVSFNQVSVSDLTATNVNFTTFDEKVIAGGSVTGTLTPDVAAGTIYQYTLNGNVNINTLANAVAGSSMVIILTQDATGSRTLTSTMKFAGGTKTLSTAANSVDIVSVFYDGTTYYATLSKGYA